MQQTETKTYFYYYQLQEAFYQRREVKVLEGMPNGYAYAYFYLKLCVESLASNGYLRCGKIPCDIKMLADITNMDIDTVRCAISVLINMDMLTQVEDGAYFIPEVPKYIGRLVNSPAAIRKRRQREREALEADSVPLIAQTNETKESVTNCHSNVTTERDNTVTNCHDNIEYIDNSLEDEEENLNINCVSISRAHTRTREEVEEFIQEHCPHIDAAGFWNYYEKHGWKIKGQDIEDWRAVAAAWEENMLREMQAPVSHEDYIKLCNQYRKLFGVSVPVDYIGKTKYIQVAIATATPLGGSGNGNV